MNSSRPASRKPYLRIAKQRKVRANRIMPKNIFEVSGGTLSPDIIPNPSLDSPLDCAAPGGTKRIGRYLLLNRMSLPGMDPTVQCYRTINLDTEKHCLCRVLPIEKYQEVLSPYWVVGYHDHISGIQELILGATEAYVFFSSNYGDLHSYVRERRRLQEDEVARLLEQIVSALRHCLEHRVLVRDVKLRKFVFKDEARTELMLEGIEDAIILRSAPVHSGGTTAVVSSQLEPSDRLTDKHGCPAYVSPEILRCRPDPAATASGLIRLTPSCTGAGISTVKNSVGGPGGSAGTVDSYSGRAAAMWSLGVLLYTSLVGQYPFHDTDPAALFAKIIRGRYSLPEFLSPLAKCMLSGLLRVNPDERLTLGDLERHPWLEKATRCAITNQIGAGSASSSGGFGLGTRLSPTGGKSCESLVGRTGETDQAVPEFNAVQESESFLS